MSNGMREGVFPLVDSVKRALFGLRKRAMDNAAEHVYLGVRSAQEITSLTSNRLPICLVPNFRDAVAIVGMIPGLRQLVPLPLSVRVLLPDRRGAAGSPQLPLEISQSVFFSVL